MTMAGAAALEPEIGSWRDRGPWWPFIPAALCFGLFVWLVPGSFVQMGRIHQKQMTEIAELPGYELVSTDIHWYPTEWGGTVVVSPLEGQQPADLRQDLIGLGYDTRAGTSLRRPRDDTFDAEQVSVRQEGPADLVVDVGVFDTDIVFAWTFLTIGAGCVILVLAGVGAAVRHNFGRQASG